MKPTGTKRLELRPVTFRAACAFVASLHRHNKPPRGHKFSIAVHDTDTGQMVGVVMVGRPIARAFDNGLTAEVNRSCTDGTPNVNSMLYGGALRACKAMGYTRAITYTQANETGSSLRAVGFVKVKELCPRSSWAACSGNLKLKAMRDPVGNGGVARVLWEWAIK